MVYLKLNSRCFLFLSLIVFLFFKQSISRHENAHGQWVKDSSLATYQKNHLSSQESNEEEITLDGNKMSKLEKEIKKEKKKKKNEIEDEENEKEKKAQAKKEKKDKKKREKDDKDDKNKTKKKKNGERNISSSASKSMSFSPNTFDSTDSLLHLSYVIDKNPIIPSGIKQGCKKGDYPRVCEATALSLMKNTDKIDASTIYYSSTQALEQALNVAKMSVLDQELGIDAKVSSVCEQVYIEALHALKDALKASVEKDRYMVLLKLSAVVTNIETCQDGIPKEINSKLEQVNMVLWRLSANAISLGAEAMPLNPHNK